MIGKHAATLGMVLSTACLQDASGMRAADAPGPTAQDDCRLGERFTHETHVGPRDVIAGVGAIAFVTNYAVNPDGAPTAYHPDDPWGERIALNTVCNAASVTTSEGTVDYRECRKLIDHFRRIRAADWLPADGARMDFYGIARRGADGDDRFVPCINDREPARGYLVSTTSLTTDPALDRRDPARFIDSTTVPFVIYPGDPKFIDRNMGPRDLVYVRDLESGHESFAVVADRGPRKGLGEGSVRLAMSLAGRNDPPRRRREVYALARARVATVVMTAESLERPFTPERIASAGEAALARFGGRERAEACVRELEGR